MQKKLILTIGMMMLLVGLSQPADLLAQNTNWGQSFGALEPDEVGQDLYLMIAKKLDGEPLDEALKATADQFGMTEGKMKAIVSGNLTPILEKQPGMSVQSAERIYSNIIDAYARNKNKADLRANVGTEVELNEIFANGELDDSGFDLIVDLNNIETILFQRNEPISFGGSYGRNAGTASEAGGSSELGSGAAAPLPSSPTPISTFDPSTGNGSKTTKNAFEESREALLEESFFGGINPSQCFVENNFEDILNEFEEESAQNPAYQNNNSSNQNSQPADDETSNNLASNNSSLEYWLNPTPPENAPSANNPVQSAKADDWSSKPICDDIICITIEALKTPAVPTFKETDNCISCHVQYINDSLQKTIKHNLIPAKVTGNFGESAMCKDAASMALGSVGLNISFTTVPIIANPKSDLLTLSSIGDEWESFSAKNGAWNYGEKERRRLEAQKTGQDIDQSPLLSTAERTYLVAIAQVADNSSQASVVEKVNLDLAKQKAEETYQVAVASVAKEAYLRADTYDSMLEQMERMNTYFESFRKLMASLNRDVPGMNSTKSCTNLLNKKECV